MKRGKLFIISAPSGCGKTTLCEDLLKRAPRVTRSVSVTTRPPRKNEKNGWDYIFVDRNEFAGLIKKKKFLEWARNFGHYYGTPKDKVLRLLARGTDVVLAIDVKGAMKVKRLYPKGVFIFILPPSMAVLEKRLRRRRTDKGLEIAKRMRIARKEISYLPRYGYSIVNDNLKKAADKLEAVVIAESCKIK